MATPQSQSGESKDRLRWTAEQDAQLISAVAKVSSENNEINWHRVADYLPKRTNKDCRKRWHYQIAREIRKGQWTREEDQRLRDAVQKYGTKWHKVSGEVGTRNGDQCWKRWNDNLDPSINHSPWKENEDALLLDAVRSMGRNWSDIVGKFLPGRTALAAKNRFTLLSRRSENAPNNAKAANSRAPLTPASLSSSSSSSRSSSSSSSLSMSSSSTASISPSPPSIQPHEEDGLNFLDMDNEAMTIDNMPMEMCASGTMSGELEGLDYDPNHLMSYMVDPTAQQQAAAECGNYQQAPSSAMQSAAGYRYPQQQQQQPQPPQQQQQQQQQQPQRADTSEYSFDKELGQAGQAGQASPASSRELGNATGRVPSQEQFLLPDESTKELIIRVRCRVGRTESTMEGLTKVINGMMVSGDVKDVNFSIL